MADDKRHQTALDRFRLVVTAEQAQRGRELEDLKFHAGDQWPEDVIAARQGVVGGQGQAAVPARPMLTIRALDQPIAQVINQARNARMAIKISPKSEGADQKTAETLQGLCRAIEYDSHAQTAYLWAYQRAVICGRGYFRVNKTWADDEGGWDQVLRIDPILNGASVYLDPWAQALNDPRAAEWGFITEDIPEDRYRREFKDTKLATMDESEILTSATDPKNPWIVSGENGERSYRIAEYWWMTYDTSTEQNPDNPEQERELKSRKVMWAKMNGVEFIEPPQEWDGTYLPIVPVIGNEMNVGGLRLFEGMIRPAMDPCRMLNYMVTSTAEQVGLATRAPWIGYEGQFEGHEPEWLASNTRNQPFLTVKAVTDATGMEVLPKPERNVAEPPIQALTQAVSLFTNFIRSTTGVPDAALGHVNPNDRSGKAIAQLQQASEQGTSNFPDNLQRAIEHAGCILLDLIPKIYDRPGRVVQILTGQDDTQSSVMLNQPFIRSQGQPQALPPGEPPPMQNGPQGPMPAPVEHYDLTKGRYSVVVEVGKSFATRRQEAMAGMASLGQAAPELVPRFADLWVKSMDIPESEAIAERLKPPGTDDNLPPQVQAAMAQMQAENQQLKQLIQTKQLEQQGQLEIAKLKAESAERIEGMAAQASLVATMAKIDSSNAQALLKAEFDRIGLMLQEHIAIIKHTAEMTHAQAQHVTDQAHDAAMQAQSHAHALEQGQQGHEQALDQIAAQPTPQPAGASGA